MVYLRVNELLKEKNRSKYWLVKNMESGYQSLSHLINNETVSIHFSTLDKLCELFDCEPGDIIVRSKSLDINKEGITKSKLLKKYEELKKQDSNTIYLFHVGIFYNILNEDAKIVNEKLGLKITDLGPQIFKCGFPISQIEKYSSLLKKNNLKYKIIDNSQIKNTNDYLNNIEIKKILKSIIEIDFNNITFQQSFNLLLNIQKKLKNIL